MGGLTDGADVERVRELAGELTSSGERIVGVGSSGSQLLTVLAEHWMGPDLESMCGQWPDIHRSIDAAGDTVRGMGEALRRNADEQDTASSGEGGPSGGGGAGSRGGGSDSGGADSGGNEDTGDPQPDDPKAEVYGELDPEIEAKWDQMTDDEKDAVLDAIIRQQAARYGVPPPDITYDPTKKSNEYGTWDEDEKKLYLNPDLLDDPQMAMNTIAHEMRHAGQHEAIRDANPNAWERFWGADPEYHNGMTPKEVEDWKKNFPDYKSTKKGDSFQEYWDQPVEKDARQAGRDYVNGLTPDQFDDLVKDAEKNTPEPGVPQPSAPPKEPGPPGVDPSPTPSPSPGPSPTPSPTGSRGR